MDNCEVQAWAGNPGDWAAVFLLVSLGLFCLAGIYVIIKEYTS